MSSLNQSLSNASPRLSTEEEIPLNFESFNFTMLREYLSWIGLFTQSKNGLELLSKHKIFGILKKFVTKGGTRDHILRTVLLSINYSTNKKSRDLLIFCLNNGSIEMKKMSMTVLRLLYRVEMDDLLVWSNRSLLA
jgi:rapamycin-insensitive companion of mTOR